MRDDLDSCFANASPSEPGLAITVGKGMAVLSGACGPALTSMTTWTGLRPDRSSAWTGTPNTSETGVVTRETVYGITGLSPERAAAQQLLSLARGHWNIEKGLHCRRDETLREGWRQLRMGHAQRMMAAINNLVLGWLLWRGVKNVPQQGRRYRPAGMKP